MSVTSQQNTIQEPQRVLILKQLINHLNMKTLKFNIILFLILVSSIAFAQENSETRKFIDDAEFTQINRDWSIRAEFKSGLGEFVSFFPVEAIDLKSNTKINALQMDMNVTVGNRNYFKSSWIDLKEVDEFINFLESYVVPNLKDKAESRQSITYVFNSKEIRFSFHIERNLKRISVYLKDFGVTDNYHYFWTETQVSRIPDLLNMLKQIK